MGQDCLFFLKKIETMLFQIALFDQLRESKPLEQKFREKKNNT